MQLREDHRAKVSLLSEFFWGGEEMPLKLWFFIRQGYRSTAQDMAASAQLDKDGLVSYLEINKISDLKAMLEG